MLVPELWLSDYIDIDVNIDEFCEKMIMSGSNIETAEPVAKGISGVVIGKVLSIEKHPDADRLVVTMIDAGQKERKIKRCSLKRNALLAGGTRP